MASTAPGNQALGDPIKGFRQFGNKHTDAPGNDENGYREGETGLQDINRPVRFPRHRLHHINPEGEQNGAEEDGHHNGG